MKKLLLLVLLIIALTGGAYSIAGCAAFHKQPTVATQQVKLTQIKKIADIFNAAGVIVEQALSVEDTLFKANLVKLDIDTSIRSTVNLLAKHVQETLNVLDDLTASDVTRRLAVQKVVEEIETGLTVQFPDASAQERIRAVFGVLKVVVGPALDLLP